MRGACKQAENLHRQAIAIRNAVNTGEVRIIHGEPPPALTLSDFAKMAYPTARQWEKTLAEWGAR
jgi:hypothetical protein